MSEALRSKLHVRSADLPPLAKRVQSYEQGPWQVHILPTAIQSVVSFQGSFCTYPEFAAGELVLQDLVVALLDKGTHRRDRFQISEELENRGAQLSFASDGLRVRFSGRALAEDVAIVLEIVAEQLRVPLVDPVEFEKARAYVAASLRRELESTGAQSSGALSRLMYAPTHPNFVMAPERALELLASYSVEDAREYHRNHFSSARGIITAVGAVGALSIEHVVGDVLSDWPARQRESDFRQEAAGYEPGKAVMSLADKSNTDVRMGHPLNVLRDDEDYIPLYIGNYVLGGNFSARLMTIIRDRMGLTYGIWSGLSGITTDYSGHWAVGLTLSKLNIEQGTDATRAEVNRFVSEGIDGTELEDKQTTIAGAFQVGLATTGGLASSLLYNAERGFDVRYLDDFPIKVKSVTVNDVNDAIRRHLDPDQLSISVAGELPA